MGVRQAKSEFAQLVKRARLERNLSQAQVASLLGVKQSAVSAWELEKAVPEVATIPDLALVLELDRERLMALKVETQAGARPRGGRGGRRPRTEDQVLEFLQGRVEDMTPEQRAELLAFIDERFAEPR